MLRSRRHRTASCRLLAGRDLSGLTCVNSLELGAAPLLPEPQKLTLRELEALARALLSVLLAFLHPGIARQKSVLAQRRAQLWIKSRYRSRQSHAHRASLPAHAAAMRRHYHVHLVRDIRKLQWLDRVMLPRVVREILFHRPAVDGELARSRTQEHARHRLLAPPGSQKPSLCAHDGRARRTQCSSSRLDDCPAAISIPVRAAANILSAACGSISNFTSAYSPLRHHLEGTATCGKNKSRLQRNSLGLLPRVPRQTSGIPVDAQLLRAPRAQLVLRQHAENRFADHPVRLGLAQPFRRYFLQPAGISAMRIINFLLDLVSGHANLVGINHDYVVARIEVWRKAGIVLAHQHARDFGRQAPQHHVRGIDNKPVCAHF